MRRRPRRQPRRRPSRTRASCRTAGSTRTAASDAEVVGGVLDPLRLSRLLSAHRSTVWLWRLEMQCPRCQHENRSGAKFCNECATALPGVAPARPYAELRDENEGLRRSLSEALEQQTATSEILRIISQSPTDVQPVFDAVARRLTRPFTARTATRSSSWPITARSVKRSHSRFFVGRSEVDRCWTGGPST